MNKIALVTDSSCDLSQDVIIDNEINVVPLRITYSNCEHRDGIDITPQEVYERLSEEVPKTSMPSIGDFLEKFNELKNNGYTHCIVITISSGLSGTYNAVKVLSRDISDMTIEVIDSKTLSMGLGFIVLEAAKMIKKNMSFNEIIDRINFLKAKVKAFFIIDTLEYLKKGGRIGKVAATLGTVLNIKPIISIDEEGKYYSYSKVRGKRQAIEKMLEALLHQVENTRAHVAILQGMAHEEAHAFAEKIKSLRNIGTICIRQITPSLAVHTGTGLLGIVFYPAEY
jgi:DegV family protein with EDD domain